MNRALSPIFLLTAKEILGGINFLEWGLFFLAALLHEMGHILAIFASGFRITSLSPDQKGLLIRTNSLFIPYRKEIFICLAGPAAGLCGAALTLLFIRRQMTEPLLYFFFCNTIFSLINLLPIKGLDGYGALFALLCLFTSRESAERLLRPWHIASLGLLVILGLSLLARWKNPSLLLLTLLLTRGEKRKKATKTS